MIISHLSSSEKETREIAQALAEKVKAGSVICLYGDLGSGKTVFCKGFAEALGIPKENVKSPTYTYLREYKKEGKNIYHYDFYRLEVLDELMREDLQEIFGTKNRSNTRHIIIEWPERIDAILPSSYIKVVFEYLSPTSRKITIHHH